MFPEKEIRLVEDILDSAYNGVDLDAVREWIGTCETAKSDLYNMLGGKLRVVADVSSNSGEEPEDGLSEDFEKSAIRDKIDKEFSTFGASINSEEHTKLVKAFEAFNKSLIPGAPNPWADKNERLVVRDSDRVIHVRAYLVAVARVLNSLVNTLTFEQIKNNRTESGMKINKYVKTFLPPDLHEQFDDKWSIVIQSIKPVKTTEDVVISIAPIDFLLQSEAMNWGSCHALRHEKGAAGCAMASDKVTLVAYRTKKRTLSGSTHHGLAIPPEMHYPDKSWRQLIHVDLHNGGAVFGKQYPSASNEVASAVRQKINYLMAEYLNVEPYWKKKGHCKGRVECNPLPYPDLHYTDCATRTLLKGIDDQGEPSVTYGEYFKCLGGCGSSRIIDEAPMCGDCYRGSRNGHCCANCGGDIDAGDGYITPDDDVVCDDCFHDNYFSCEDCDELHHRDNVSLVYRDGMERGVCRICLDDYSECESCGEIVDVVMELEVTKEGDTECWCESCYEDKAIECEVCSNMIVDYVAAKSEWVGGTWVEESHCQACRDEIVRDLKKEEAI